MSSEHDIDLKQMFEGIDGKPKEFSALSLEFVWKCDRC